MPFNYMYSLLAKTSDPCLDGQCREYPTLSIVCLYMQVKLLHALARMAIKILHRLAGNFWQLCGLKSVLNGITCDIINLAPPPSVVRPWFHYTPTNTTLRVLSCMQCMKIWNRNQKILPHIGILETRIYFTVDRMCFLENENFM